MKNNLNIYYDEEGDFLELRMGDPTNSYYEEISDDIFERFDEKTNEIKGFAIFSFRKIIEKTNAIWYDEEEDILNIQLCNEKYFKSIELSNNILYDITKEGKIISIEILRASKVFSGDFKKVLDLFKEVA